MGSVHAGALTSRALDTHDYAPIALEVFGDEDALMARESENEFAFENFVRSVLDPVRSLPATRLPIEPASTAR